VTAEHYTDLQISKFQSILIKVGLSSINLQWGRLSKVIVWSQRRWKWQSVVSFHNAHSMLISMYIHWAHYFHTNSHNESDIQTKRGW